MYVIQGSCCTKATINLKGNDGKYNKIELFIIVYNNWFGLIVYENLTTKRLKL